MSEEKYGRSSPDIIREPVHISRLVTEFGRDLVDETYRTQHINQRVININPVGVLERKIITVLQKKKNSIASNKNKIQNIRSERKSVTLAREPIRKNRFLNDTRSNIFIHQDYRLNEETRIHIERCLDRFSHLSHKATKNREERGLFGLPLEKSTEMSANLVALSTTYWSHLAYLGSVGRIRPQKIIRYTRPSEFFRKRNARRSPLYYGSILRYMDLLLKVRPPIMGLSRGLSNGQQQHNLYRTRLISNEYTTTARQYFLRVRNIARNRRRSKTFTKLSQRTIFQRELHLHLARRSHSYVVSNLNQQYIGNLQIIRRLMAVSWSSCDTPIYSRLRGKRTTFLRRKVRYDLICVNEQRDIFDHEELGKSMTLKIQKGKERSQDPALLLDLNGKIIKTERFCSFTLPPKQRYFPDSRVEAVSLHGGLDSRLRAFVFSNQSPNIDLVNESTVMQDPEVSSTHITESLIFKNKDYRSKSEFTIWTKNIQSRQIRLHNVRYKGRALLSRRVNPKMKNTEADLLLLSRERNFWTLKASSSERIAFTSWFRETRDKQSRTGKRIIREVHRARTYPLSIERSTNQMTYVPGDLQPVSRGGVTWPETDPFLFIKKKFNRPGSDREFTKLRLVFLFKP
jgi:hypothetical protein